MPFCMDSSEKDLQLAHKQDVQNQLFYTDRPLFPQNFSNTLGVGFWGVLCWW